MNLLCFLFESLCSIVISNQLDKHSQTLNFGNLLSCGLCTWDVTIFLLSLQLFVDVKHSLYLGHISFFTYLIKKYSLLISCNSCRYTFSIMFCYLTQFLLDKIRRNIGLEVLRLQALLSLQ